MAAGAELVQGGRLDALRRVAGNAELSGDTVGGVEPHAGHVAREPVRIVLQHGPRAGAELPVDTPGVGGGDAVRLQEQHGAALFALLVPGAPHLAGAGGADTGHLAQPRAGVVEHLQGAQPEVADDAAREAGPDAGHHPGTEILLQAGHRARRDGGVGLRLEAAPIPGVIDPVAGQADRFAGLDAEQVADRNRLGAALGLLQDQHREAALPPVRTPPGSRSPPGSRAGCHRGRVAARRGRGGR